MLKSIIQAAQKFKMVLSSWALLPQMPRSYLLSHAHLGLLYLLVVINICMRSSGSSFNDARDVLCSVYFLNLTTSVGSSGRHLALPGNKE